MTKTRFRLLIKKQKQKKDQQKLKKTLKTGEIFKIITLVRA